MIWIDERTYSGIPVCNLFMYICLCLCVCVSALLNTHTFSIRCSLNNAYNTQPQMTFICKFENLKKGEKLTSIWCPNRDLICISIEGGAFYPISNYFVFIPIEMNLRDLWLIEQRIWEFPFPRNQIVQKNSVYFRFYRRVVANNIFINTSSLFDIKYDGF